VADSFLPRVRVEGTVIGGPVDNIMAGPLFALYPGIGVRAAWGGSTWVIEGLEAALRRSGFIAVDQPVPRGSPGMCANVSMLRDGRLRVRLKPSEAAKADTFFRAFMAAALKPPPRPQRKRGGPES
jgi:hypothetical protein